jgi:serine/threonine-protein kinase
VYRARDTNLGRDVALKVLPDSVTHDHDRLIRFRREAQLLAALNHPHIAGIYGLEEADGQSVLVLELVEGETLAERLRQGPLPVEEALAIAGEIAEALEAAHDRGIIHRDLKPANIALTPQDRVKVLDFGLAKATDVAAASGGDPLNSPTVTSPAMLTGVGVILGTAAYMSPEQSRGRVADKRSDIWAFGCVLYEMLTGQRAFKGEDVSDTLASVLRSDPDWSALPPSLPPAVRSLLTGCLDRSHRDRIGDISAALFVLKRVPRVTVDVPSGHSVNTAWPKVWWALAGVAAGAAAAMLLWQHPLLPERQVARFALDMPDAQLTLSRPSIAVSPDGRHIAYVADGRLYLRSVSAGVSRPVPGADPAVHPAFSPDSRSIVFWTEPALKRISVTGGMPVTLCPTAPAPFGLDWSEGGIVYVEPGTGIMRVSENGGTPETLVRLGESEELVQSPQLLPDGDTLLFTLAPRLVSSTSPVWDTAQIVAQSLKTGERKTLVSGGSDARYIRTGHLIYMVEGTMMAVAFDLRSLTTAASGATPVVEGVRRSAPLAGGGAHFGLSATGLLAYLPGPARAGQDEMFLYNRKGDITPLKLPLGVYAYPRASLDGKWLAFEASDGKNATVSVYELSGASSVRRLTFGGNNRSPIWSRDGTRVAFQSDREGDLGIFWQPLHGGTAERLTRAEPGTAHVPESWSPRSDVFLYAVTGESETSLWLYSIADRKSSRFGGVTSTFLTDAVFSPDGRWIAYQAADPGMGEATTYVQPYPPTGAKYEIARGGRPMWSHDGKELFFVPGPGQFRSVSVRTEPAFGFTAPAAVPRRFGLAPPASPRPFDILPNGQFVALDAVQRENFSSQIHVVLNWFEELKAKAPAAK